MIRTVMDYCTGSRKRLTITCIVGISLIALLIATAVLLIRNSHRPPVLAVSSVRLQEEIDHKNTFYRSQNNTIDQQTLRNDTIQQLAKDSLVYNYAKAHNISVTQQEIATVFQQRASAAGSEQLFLEKLNSLYGINKQQYLSNIQLDILKDKVQHSLGNSLSSWLDTELPRYRVVITK